jgi:hypothetical protein
MCSLMRSEHAENAIGDVVPIVGLQCTVARVRKNDAAIHSVVAM